ncbi:MAG TPA: hypothetical protein VF781_05560, partial [Solirubrobacteraceae bacterium]
MQQAYRAPGDRVNGFVEPAATVAAASGSTAVAFTEVPGNWRAFARQRRRWARGMIEGLRDHGFGLLRKANLYSHSVAGNFLFPFLDACFTL